MVRSSSSSCLARLGAAGIDQRARLVPVASGLGSYLTSVHSTPHRALGSSTVPFAPPGQPYLSATSALSSERSSSPSRITSFLAT